MIERAIEVLIRFASNNDPKVKLADVELENKYIHMDDFLLHSDSITQYKRERQVSLNYLSSHGLTRFFNSLDTRNVDISILAGKIKKYSLLISNHNPIYATVPKYLSNFMSKNVGYYIYFIFAIIASFFVSSSGYILFWYNYLLTIMFGYIFVENMHRHALRVKADVDQKNKELDEEVSNFVQEYNDLLSAYFKYEELKFISDELCSNRFIRHFSYVNFVDFINTSSSDGLLDRANETIRKANARISELKIDLSSKESTIRNLHDQISKLNSRSYSSSKEECPYEVLGLKLGETDKEKIKSNYKKLSNIYHFDRSGSNTMMKKVNAAYDSIKNS